MHVHTIVTYVRCICPWLLTRLCCSAVECRSPTATDAIATRHSTYEPPTIGAVNYEHSKALPCQHTTSVCICEMQSPGAYPPVLSVCIRECTSDDLDNEFFRGCLGYVVPQRQTAHWLHPSSFHSTGPWLSRWLSLMRTCIRDAQPTQIKHQNPECNFIFIQGKIRYQEWSRERQQNNLKKLSAFCNCMSVTNSRSYQT